ncbi:hypothetical protein INT45_010005 [Circinella minor]|uniref:Histone transcription regulator 3 homolog n=1 Tax=Circinella minor TaxID=1195481 RepID=A0A8H7S6M9_9FUNG|nr:hypothetical protein INT45_010005 [Circinella minor]
MTNSSLVMLRFLVYKNYAVLLKDEFDRGCSQDKDKGKEAIKYYLMALDIDESEQTLWYRVGELAYATKNNRLARLAYEHGLYVIAIREKYPDQFDEDVFNENTGSILNFWNELEQIILSGRISPIQWRCLEGLCQVLVDIGDYELCESYMALASQHYHGWPLLAKLEKKMNSSRVISDIKTIDRLRIKLSKVRWATLLKTLMEKYDELTSTDNDENPLYHDVPTINRSIHIDVTARDNICHTEDNRQINQSSNIDDDDDIMLESPQNQRQTMDITENQQEKNTERQLLADKISHFPEPTKKESADQDVQMINVDQVVKNSYLPSSAVTSDTTENAQNIQEESVSGSKIVIDLSMDDDDDDDDDEDRKRPDALNNRDNSQASSTQNTKIEDKENSSNQQYERMSLSVKRKRSTESIEENDKEDESESEDKRATLRTSKRQKEKIENEETSRRKMLNEEDQLSQSIQDVFNTLAEVSDIKRQQPWHAPIALPFDDSAMVAFWKWFDKKVEELSKRYAWDYDNTRSGNGIDMSLSASSSTPVESNNISQYPIFERSVINKQVNRPVEEATVLNLIDTLNNENLGVMDSVLQTALNMLEQDIQYDIDSNTADLFVDAINLLGCDFVEQYLFNENDSIGHSQKKTTVKLVLQITERMVDKLINMIHISLENYSSSSSTRKKSNAVKHAEKAAVQKFIGVSDAWVGILERSMLRQISGLFLSSTQFEELDNEQANTGEIMLRYWFIRGKVAQCKNEVDKAFEWYTRCEKILDQQLAKNITIDLKCRYDGILSLDTIRKKLKSLEMGKYMLSAKTKFVNKEYSAIIEELSDAVENKLQDTQNRSSELCEMLSLLAKSYTEMGEHVRAWKCHIRILYYQIYDLVLYGIYQTNDEEFAPKDTDIVFFKHLKKIDLSLQEIVNLLLEKSLAVDKETTDTLLIVLQMAVRYVYRHPDFIPIANNFTTSSAEPHEPSNVTRTSRFNSIVINSWVLTSTLIQKSIPNDNSTASIKSKHTLVDTLISLHDELGERQICGVAKGAFLKYLLKLPPQENNIKYKIGVFQCYHCLYGVAIEDDDSEEPIEEHYVQHEELTQKAAEPLFALMVDSVVQRLDRGAPLKTAKEVIDIISNIFDSLPTQDNNVRLNKRLIEVYLSQDVKITPSINSTLRDSLLSAIPIDIKRTKISPVYFQIFWLQGRMTRVQIKNRPKFNAEKNAEDLENAIELFTNHVVLNPYDMSGWAELGHCYASLADEELIWSAMNIKTHRVLIAAYQKKAYHAFCRAHYLHTSGESSEKPDQYSMFEMYMKFGNLLYSMVCPPMKAAVLETKYLRRIMTADNQLGYSSANPYDTKNVYKMALVMFNYALRFKSAEKWRCYMMIGSCYKKMGRPAKEVLQWYQRAVKKLPRKQAKSERIYEPVYKLYSALAKYLYKREIEPSDITNYLDIGTPTEDISDQQEDTSTDHYETPPSTSEGEGLVVPTSSSSKDDNSTKRDSLMERTQNDPYDILLDRLMDIRRADKQKKHHRPRYRIAWILYHVYNQPEAAKKELLELFSLRSNSKSYQLMWKTPYERPGRFFEYVHQSTLLLIELAKETNDIERLKLLKEKLHKAASTVLLYTEELTNAVDEAITKVTANSLQSLDTREKKHHHDASNTEREGDGEGDNNNTTTNNSTSLSITPDVIIL